jgi:hypothetical protein
LVRVPLSEQVPVPELVPVPERVPLRRAPLSEPEPEPEPVPVPMPMVRVPLSEQVPVPRSRHRLSRSTLWRHYRSMSPRRQARPHRRMR